MGCRDCSTWMIRVSGRDHPEISLTSDETPFFSPYYTYAVVTMTQKLFDRFKLVPPKCRSVLRALRIGAFIENELLNMENESRPNIGSDPSDEGLKKGEGGRGRDRVDRRTIRLSSLPVANPLRALPDRRRCQSADSKRLGHSWPVGCLSQELCCNMRVGGYFHNGN